MLKRLAAFFIVLAFASQTLAGVLMSGKIDRNGVCEMACCALAKSAVAMPMAMICCQTVCGESNAGLQSEAAAQKQLTAPPVASHRTLAFNLSHPVAIPIFLRSADAAFLHRDPPALFLQHSSFLI